MRSHAKAPSAGTDPGTVGLGTLRSVASVCALATLALLATSASVKATECPNEAIRTGAGANLPDCRAYELVTPPDKDGYSFPALSNYPNTPAREAGCKEENH